MVSDGGSGHSPRQVGPESEARGQGSADWTEPPQPSPLLLTLASSRTHVLGATPGGTTPHWAAPPARTVHYIWLEPRHRAETNRAPRKAAQDARPHSLPGVVVPALCNTAVHQLTPPFLPHRAPRAKDSGPRALWERRSGCQMRCSVRMVQDYISRCTPRWAGPGSEGCEASLEVVRGARR